MPYFTDTTDVQHVRAAIAVTSDTTSSTTIAIQCIFINGSTANGCRVLLVLSDFENMTVDLKREARICAETTLTLDNLEPVDVANVLGFDVESDGEVGVRAVQGEVTTIDVFGNSCLRDAPLSPTPRLDLSE